MGARPSARFEDSIITPNGKWLQPLRVAKFYPSQQEPYVCCHGSCIRWNSLPSNRRSAKIVIIHAIIQDYLYIC